MEPLARETIELTVIAALRAFKHALIQESAYGSLLRGTRQQYHRLIAEVPPVCHIPRYAPPSPLRAQRRPGAPAWSRA